MTPPEPLAVQSSQPSHRQRPGSVASGWRRAGAGPVRAFGRRPAGAHRGFGRSCRILGTSSRGRRRLAERSPPDTEYWCPMCPGVVSDWPSKCPVCSMSLVRREKGEMTPLPDGVVARVQLSPYRLQLAGIRTSPVEFRRLEHEVVAGGLLEAESGSPASSSLVLTADVFERDAAVARGGAGSTALLRRLPG